MADGGLHVRPELARLRIETFDSREAWLQSRAAVDVIGGSEAAAVLGVSPYSTAWSLWESKREPKKDKPTEPMKRGNRWEPAVLAEYEDESRIQVITPAAAVGKQHGTIVVLSSHRCPWLRATPDAFGVDQRGTFGQVEAKTAVDATKWSPEPGIVIERWDDSCADIVPPHIAIQNYVQLITSELPWVDACALVPKGKWLVVRWVRIEADPSTQHAIEDALGAWREKHLIRGEAPDVDESDACNRYLAKKFPTREGKAKLSRAASEAELAWMLELYEARQRIKSDKKRADKLRNQLIESAQGHLLYTGMGKSPFGQPQFSKGKRSVDMEGLRREAPDLVKKYEEQGSPYTTFNLYRFEK
jgi:putative phage-type endonuclease